MFVKVHTPCVIDGLGRCAKEQIIALAGREALPLIAAGKATPRPEIDSDERAFQERKERARRQGQAVDWDMQQPHAPRRPRAIVANAVNSESFAEKIKRAIAARQPRAQTQKQHDEQAAREKARYRGYKRKRCKGE